jgi:hypothetical protein
MSPEEHLEGLRHDIAEVDTKFIPLEDLCFMIVFAIDHLFDHPLYASSSLSRPQRDLAGWRSAMGLRPTAFERCSDLAEPVCAELTPVWKLVASLPAPRCDHR